MVRIRNKIADLHRSRFPDSKRICVIDRAKRYAYEYRKATLKKFHRTLSLIYLYTVSVVFLFIKMKESGIYLFSEFLPPDMRLFKSFYNKKTEQCNLII